MAKNKAFLNVLKGISSLPGWVEEEDRLQFEQERADALDALLAADPNDSVAFREAISEHVEFWNNFEDLKPEAYHDFPDESAEDDLEDDLPASLTPDLVNADNEDAFLQVGHEITLTKLHQQAAEQRVKLGLKNAPEDVLINILSNNPDECRAYLATKSSLLNPPNVAGWKADEVIPGALPQTPKKNTSTDVLTDEAIKNIQNEAVFLLLDKQIVQCTEVDKLEALYDAISEGSQLDIEDAIKDIDFPQGIGMIALRSLKSASELIYDAEDSIFIQSLKKRITQLKQELAHQQFAQYVADLTPEELLNQKDLLEKDNDDFIDALRLKFQHLDPDEANISWAKGLLGARFLQAYLPVNQTPVELLALVNTADPQALREQVKRIATVGDHDYIDEAITDDTISSLKTAMVQSIISTIPGTTKKEIDTLTALANAKTFAQFNAALPGLDITQVNWLKHDAEMLSMQQSARSRLFEINLSSKSQLGTGTNPKLMEAFKSIPPEKQSALLKQSEQLHHLLNAQNAETVTYYLGKEISDDLVDAVLTENKTNSLYRDIPNAAVANLLAHLNLNPKLTSEKIKDITEAIIIYNNLADNFNDPDKYKNFVDSIKVHCSGVTDAAFYDAFGLTADGSAFTVPTSKDQVKAQQDNNRALMIAVRRPVPSVNDNKELYKFFLKLDKGEIGNPANITVAFNKSETLKEFIDEVSALQPLNPKLQRSLTNALTSTVFNDLKKEYTKKQFLEPDPVKSSSAIQKMSEQLEAMQKSHKPLTGNREAFEFISKVKPIHLFNPAFRDKASTDSVAMIKEYRAAAEDCDHLMDQLRRDQIKLTNYLASIPHPSTHANSKVRKDMDNLHQKISSELAEVDKALEFYEKVQNNLSGENGILQAIDEAVAGRKNYIYTIQGSVKAHPPCAREELPPLPGGVNPLGPNRTQVVSGGSTEDVQNFLLEKEIPQGMVKAFDVAYEVTTAPSATNRTGKVNTVGRFTQSHPSELEAVTTSKNGTVSKISHSRFEIEAFPKGDGPEFDAAKVNFAMAAAVAILASRDNVPSKEHPLILKGENKDEMAYLWTALVKLGEDPNMKFDVSAIKVNSSTFKPDTQLGTVWGFSSNSLYENQFKNAGAAVSQKAEHLAEVTKAKFGHSDEKQKSDKGIGLFRTEVKDLRDKAAKSIEEEGPAFKGPGR